MTTASLPTRHPAPTARITSRRRVFDGYHSLELITATPRSLRSDGFTAEMTREIFSCKPYALVVPYVPESDEILLNEQFRLGAFMVDPDQPFLLECVAGVIDDGETPEAAALRETREETGCDARDLIAIGSFFPSPGCIDELYHAFVGRIAATTEGGVFGLAAEGEEIRTHLLPADEVFRLLDAGMIRSAPAALALNWFARHRDRLRTYWLNKETT